MVQNHNYKKDNHSGDMMLNTKKAIFMIVGALIASLAVSTAQSQTYPERPIRLVVGFSPGGPTDLAARIAGRIISDGLGQPVIIENRPGAGGELAATLVAKAPADGYTLLVNVTADVVSPIISKNRREPLLRSFVPVANICTAPNVLVVHPSVPAANVAELVALARKKDFNISYGSAGTGTVSHLSGVLLATSANVELTHVPYNGTAAAQSDLLSGRLSIMFDNLGNGLANAQSQKVRAIAVTAATRWYTAPDVPTMKESGFPGAEIESIFGLLAPIGTPSAIVSKIAAALQAGLVKDTHRQSLLRMGLDPSAMGPTDYLNYIRTETARWEKMVSEGTIKLE
jgi:tripartite-type tricarboxylate transporter receptor subunit TctC